MYKLAILLIGLTLITFASASLDIVGDDEEGVINLIEDSTTASGSGGNLSFNQSGADLLYLKLSGSNANQNVTLNGFSLNKVFYLNATRGWFDSVSNSLSLGTTATGGELYFGTNGVNKISYASSEFGFYTGQSRGFIFHNKNVTIDNNLNLTGQLKVTNTSLFKDTVSINSTLNFYDSIGSRQGTIKQGAATFGFDITTNDWINLITDGSMRLKVEGENSGGWGKVTVNNTLVVIGNMSAENITVTNILINGSLPCLNDSTNCPPSSGGMNYTNLAMRNESNTFTQTNTFNQNITINGGYLNGDRQTLCFTKSATGANTSLAFNGIAMSSGLGFKPARSGSILSMTVTARSNAIVVGTEPTPLVTLTMNNSGTQTIIYSNQLGWFTSSTTEYSSNYSDRGIYNFTNADTIIQGSYITNASGAVLISECFEFIYDN